MTSPMHYMAKAMVLVVAERERQEALVAAGVFKHSCSFRFAGDGHRLAVLTEEVGEFAKEINERPNVFAGEEACDASDQRMIDELTQVAAVALASIEGMLHLRAETANIRDLKARGFNPFTGTFRPTS